MFKPFGLALINVAQTVDETPVFELYYESLAANDQWCSSFLNFSKLAVLQTFTECFNWNYYY